MLSLIMSSIGLCDHFNKVPDTSYTIVYVLLKSVIVIIWLILSVSVCPVGVIAKT
jgi:hypothetical protein